MKKTHYLKKYDDNTKLEISTELIMDNIANVEANMETLASSRPMYDDSLKAKKYFGDKKIYIKSKIKKLMDERNKIYSYNYQIIDEVINNYNNYIEIGQGECSEDEFDLTKEEIEEIYQKIFKIMTEGKSPVDTPTAIINLGAPGAGKTGLNAYSLNQFEGKNAIIINGDEIRNFHPRYNEILAKFPNEYARISGKASNLWTSRLIKDCAEKKYNIIFEGTGRNLEILNTIKNQLNNYKVLVRVLAVSKSQCLLSVLKRYKALKDKKGVGRLIEIEKFNLIYDNIALNISIIEKNGIEVEVYKRGISSEEPVMLYSSNESRNLNVMDVISNQCLYEEYLIKYSENLCMDFLEVLNSLNKKELVEAKEIIIELYNTIIKILSPNSKKKK